MLMDNRNWMSAAAVTTAIVLVLPIFFLYWQQQRRRRTFQPENKKQQPKRQLPPCCPSGYIETTRQIASPLGVWFMVKWARKLGTSVFQIRIPHPCHAFVVGDPDVARAILQDPTTIKPVAFYGPLDISAGASNIFSANGERWRHARKAAAPAFAKVHIQRMNQVCLEELEHWIQRRLDVFIDEPSPPPLDIAQEMIILTLTIISKSAMEYDMTNDEAALFVQEVDLSIREFLVRQGSNPLRRTWLGYWMDGKVIRRAEQANRNIQAFAKNILDTYRNNHTTTQKNNTESGTVIEHIVMNPHYTNDEERIADILIFLVGGHDTTAYTLAWTLLELARNPHVMEHVRNELDQCPTNEERLACPTLDHVITESMRLNPVGAAYLREVQRDFPVVKNNDDDDDDDDGTSRMIIPKGSVVFISNLIMHRNPLYFDRPDEFIPTRWEIKKEDEKGDPTLTTKALSHAFAPFSVGPRNCIGQALAQAELHTVLARLIMDYDFQVVDPGHAECTLTFKPMGLQLRAMKRKRTATTATMQ